MKLARRWGGRPAAPFDSGPASPALRSGRTESGSHPFVLSVARRRRAESKDACSATHVRFVLSVAAEAAESKDACSATHRPFVLSVARRRRAKSKDACSATHRPFVLSVAAEAAESKDACSP